MVLIQDIIDEIEKFAPKNYQESYDNSGLLIGDAQNIVSQALITLDCTEAVVDDAIALNAQLIIAHHPIIFNGLKSITGKNYIERVVLKAIKNDIAIYAAHTNLDNVNNGVNAKIASKLGLLNCSILEPKENQLMQLYTYVPISHADDVRKALFDAGAGQIGEYSNCSFNIIGNGSYMASNEANPFMGKKNELHQEKEIKIEVIIPSHKELQVIEALKTSHPYEEVAFGTIQLSNKNPEIGSGLIGDLKDSMSEQSFLKHLKESMNLNTIKYTPLNSKQIKKVAICGGSGSFLLRKAIQMKADAFVTADFKYHEYFDAENKIMIADIGHYESEQFTSEIFIDLLSKKFPNFAIQITSVNTNPIQYY